ncbi:MAG TPA: SRPBCC domain-containing protein [Gemmatimonadales bacterium]|nr:SRPBCC domain-containing protein [Gemmatimonadales bacterium]
MTRPPITLVVRKTIAATPERLFAAWTEPTQVVRWWGPDGVTCIGAEVDLRVGGHYRIGNRLPDGAELWISGTFEAVERPLRLIYSWRIEGAPADAERVTVVFEGRGLETEVTVTHARILSQEQSEQHRLGWEGCLDHLAAHFA